jgi:hypothetical protein
MKKIFQAEDVNISAYAFIDGTDFAPIAVRKDSSPAPVNTSPKTKFLDSFVTAVKWVFFTFLVRRRYT